MAKGPDSSLGEEHRESCSEDIHMEEEGVQVKVQVEEQEEIGEIHGREQSEEKGREQTIKSHTRMTIRMRRSVHQHVSHAM